MKKIIAALILIVAAGLLIAWFAARPKELKLSLLSAQTLPPLPPTVAHYDLFCPGTSMSYPATTPDNTNTSASPGTIGYPLILQGTLTCIPGIKAGQTASFFNADPPIGSTGTLNHARREPNTPALAFTGRATLISWVKTHSPRDNDVFDTHAIMSKYSTAGQDAGYLFMTDKLGRSQLQLGGDNILARGTCTSVGGAPVNSASAQGVRSICKDFLGASIKDDNWHMVSVTITPTAVQFYVDCVPTTRHTLSIRGGDNGTMFRLGFGPNSEYYAGGFSAVWYGGLAHNRIYNVTLTDSQMCQLFNGERGTVAPPPPPPPPQPPPPPPTPPPPSITLPFACPQMTQGTDGRWTGTCVSQ